MTEIPQRSLRGNTRDDVDEELVEEVEGVEEKRRFCLASEALPALGGSTVVAAPRRRNTYHYEWPS